ncbi:MAG: flagellar biosynthetic protein FliR [Rhodothermales bacterium]
MVINPEYLAAVFLVFVRLSGLFVTAPFFSHRSVPVRVRIFLAVLLAHALVGLISSDAIGAHTLTPVGMAVAVILEALTGILLGFAAQLIFWALQYAGEIMGFQMGLAMAHVFNPIDGTQSNTIGNILTLTFLIVFLLLDGHHHVLRAVVISFDVVPLAGARLAAGAPLLLQWMSDFFTTALRLAAPFMVTIFLVDVALGVFARMVPQADLFSLGLPVKLLAGILLLLVYTAYFFPLIPDLLAEILSYLRAMIEALIPA